MTDIIKSAKIDKLPFEKSGLANVDYQAILLEMEEQRLRNYQVFWALYKGLHWGEDEMEEGGVLTPVWNKCKTFINKSITFLVGKPFTINYLLPSVEKLLAPFINLLMKNSGGIGIFSWEGAQIGSVTGDCFIKPVYDEDIKGVRLQVCDSSDVAVKYSFVDYKNNIPDVAEIKYKFLDTDEKIKTRKEIWKRGSKEVFIDDIKIEGESGGNILGMVPMVHIRNQIVGKEVYGTSDIADIENLNKLLNKSIRQFQNNIDYHGNPTTLAYGVRLKNLEKGEDNLIANIPINGKIENLTLDTDFPAHQKFIEYINKAIHDEASIPEKSTTGDMQISNTSGVAMHIAFMPLIELTDRKKLTYGPGFEKALAMGLSLMAIMEKRHSVLKTAKVDELSQADKRFLDSFVPIGILDARADIVNEYKKSRDPFVKLREWNHNEVQFQDYMPKDKLIEVQLIQAELNAKLESRKGAMRRMGKDNIDLLLKEIDDDIQKEMDLRANELYGKVMEKRKMKNPGNAGGFTNDIKQELNT